MARDNVIRYTLTGTLECRTPLHVGGHGEDPDTDLPVARDGRERCYVPGTSLAGAMREWCRIAFDEPAVRDIWGFQDRNGGHASYITVEDVFVDEKDLIPEVRDGVGIDRVTGAAADRIKFDRAVLPRGTKLTGFTVVAEVPEDRKEAALSMLAGLKTALESGRFRLGAARTRGLGRVLLANATLKQIELKTQAGIFALLRSRGGNAGSQPDLSKVTPPKTPSRLRICIKWHPVGPLMVKAGFDGVAVDMLPLVSGLPGGVAPVLPGSSVKGAFRNRAEVIVRTLLGSAATGGKEFLSDVRVPLVEKVFGVAGGADGDPESSLGLGALAIDDCYGMVAVHQRVWDMVANAKDDPGLRTALNAAGGQDWQQAYHVAIDRWTGGAAESMLYTVLAPHGVAWEPLELEVNLCRVSPAGVALMMLVLRDLAKERLPLGFGVNRGMGAVKVDEVTVTPENAPAIYGNGPFDLSTIPVGVKTVWKEWLEEKVPA